MTLFGICAVLTGVTCILMGIFVIFQVKGEKYKLTWLGFTFTISIWGFGSFIATMAPNAAAAMFWWKITIVGPIFVPVFFFHFVCVYLKFDQKYIIRSIYAMGIIFTAINFFYEKLFLNTIRTIYDNVPGLGPLYWYKTPGIAFNTFYVLFYIGVLLYAYVLLLKKLRISSGIERTRIKYIIAGCAVGWIGAESCYLIGWDINFYPASTVLMPVFIFIIGYAMIKHQLLGIEVIVKKTLVFTGLLVTMMAVLILPTLIIQGYISRSAGFGGRIVGLTISGIIIIMTIRRIEIFLINVTDKYLFQKKYDYKELLKTFTTEVLTVLELGNLVDLTVNKMSEIVKLNSCAVLLFDDEKQEFSVTASKGLRDETVTLIRPDGIVTFMEETHGYILVKELREKKISVPDSIQEIIDKLNAELIIPLVLHNEVIGVLSLGKKKSDEDYSQDDLDILLPLAKTLAIAISNAELFVELGQTQAEAAQAEKMAVIGTLSAGINHEICNPLGIARGQCEAFLLNISDGLYKHKNNEELLAKAKEIMRKVIHETDRATAITKKLSQFAKPSKGESELVDIAKEVEEVIGLVGYELKLEKIEFLKNIEPGLPDIFVDKKQFGEVLFNLIRNAGQAIREKGRITVNARQGKGKIFIDVQDTGSGISEENAKKLFNPFFTTKDPGKGTGLGLFIVRQVVEKNGGRIYLKETKVGEGTTFTLEFPPAPAGAAKTKVKS